MEVMPATEKKCSKCGGTKPLDDFYKNKKNKDGKSYSCKPCQKATTDAWKEKNPEALHKHKLKYRYGITPEQYDEMVAKAGGKCQLCGLETKLHIDHCHKNGHVRGVLCGPCNRAIGQLGDSEESIRRVLDYLGTQNAIL